MSPESAGLAHQWGYKNVYVYLAGEADWTESGYLTYASDDFIENGNIVLLDLRDGDSARTGRIPNAVCVPYDKLEDRMKDIPKRAPVVVYGDDEEVVADAVEDLRDAGYALVSAVEGNYQGWVNAGKKVEKGDNLKTEINWVYKLGDGEVSIEDFLAAVDGDKPDVAIVDVRTEKEVAGDGKFAGSVNIPLDRISVLADKLPKDKTIYLHCVAGVRAELAYKTLKDMGFKVKYLPFNIKKEPLLFKKLSH